MSDNKQILPSTIASPTTELNLRAMSLVAGALIVGWGVKWMESKGWVVPDKDQIAIATQLMGGVIMMGLAYIAAFRVKKNNEQAIVKTAVQVAEEQAVPAAIVAKATPVQAARIEASPAGVTDAAPASTQK